MYTTIQPLRITVKTQLFNVIGYKHFSSSLNNYDNYSFKCYRRYAARLFSHFDVVWCSTFLTMTTKVVESS
jgi:hypothetical protein